MQIDNPVKLKPAAAAYGSKTLFRFFCAPGNTFGLACMRAGRSKWGRAQTVPSSRHVDRADDRRDGAAGHEQQF